MSNVSKSNKFNVRIDLDKSQGSYLHDKNRNKKLLDFVGMFASLPLGYNHPIFKTDKFKEEVMRVSHTKVTNCFIGSDESLEFDSAFTKFTPACFTNFYYCCTGSLAVEASIKCVLEMCHKPDPKIITFNKSFHGINGWASFVTSRQDHVKPRLEGYPKPKNLVLECEDNISHFQSVASENNIAAVLIEPIRSTHGDLYFEEGFIKEICSYCERENIPIIFDEVQTGMGVTGTYWYYEQLGVQPDVVVFGKKAQLSGIMATDKVSSIFKQKEKKLEATWDATLLDMVRCKNIIKAYDELDILENVRKRGTQLRDGITNPRIKNIRSAGLLLGFDLESERERDKFQEDCFYQGLLVNTAAKTTIRLRPNLAIDYNDMERALNILNNV